MTRAKDNVEEAIGKRDMRTQLWICGKVLRDNGPDDVVWEFQGVFDSEEKARSACRNDRYFIAPAELNIELPDETVPWPGGYGPLASGSE